MPFFTARPKHQYLLLVCLGMMMICGKSFSQMGKINPILRHTIEQSSLTPLSDTVAGKNPSRFLIMPSARIASGGAITQAGNAIDCIVYTSNGQALKAAGYNVRSVLPNLVTATLTPDQISSLSERPDIQYIDLPRRTRINNDMSTSMSGAKLLHHGKLNNTIYKGKGTIVAIFDTGIDWNHPDFKDPNDNTKSRILCIWDQTLTANIGDRPAPGFDYGVYYTQAQINAELASPSGSIREEDLDGHGTHVAGTAAGNGNASVYRQYEGFAPEADIVVIKGGDGSFSSVNEIDAVTFLKHLADSLQRPVILNMSLGGQFSAHDGTDATDQAIDNFTSSGNGRVAVIAAGNDNGKNIHNQLALPANGKASFTFTIDSGGVDSTDYVLDYLLYLNNNNNISAVVTDPLGVHSDTVTMGNVTASQLDTTGSMRVQLVADIDPANNNTYLEFYIDRTAATKANPRGVWTLTLINNSASAATVDGWIAGTGNSGAFANTKLSGGDNNYLIGSPGDATSAITAASYNTKISWIEQDGSGSAYYDAIDSISSFSSHGPRRDGFPKPELTAPGQGIVSCRSAASTALDPISTYYTLEQGTSMATPAITGSVSLLLQADPNATAADIKNLLQANVNKDYTPASLSYPNAIWGAGKLDVYKAAAAIFNAADRQRKLYKYENSASLLDAGFGAVNVGSVRVATRFSPDITGKLAGAYFQSYFTLSSLIVEVRTSKNNMPDSLLGSVHVDSTAMAELSMNYINLDSLNIPVTAGRDYFIEMYLDTLAPAGSNWQVCYNTHNPVGRSVISTTNGQSWSAYSNNFIIRSDVYADGLTDAIASVTSDSAHNVNTNDEFRNGNNELIAQVTPAGTSPVSGNITAKVWLETSVPAYGADKYVSRHYQITPAVNSTTATAQVTLYFRQEEFDAFNTANADGLLLPAGPTDSAGIRNLLIGKYSGVSSDGTGTPSSYSSAETIIDPDDNNVVWNAVANRWEVTFSVTGFSGFIVQTKNAALPIKLNYFTGSIQGKHNVVKWQAATANGIVTFAVQRSASGDPATFTTIHTDNPSVENSLNPFTYTDTLPLQGDNYYRLKMTESPGGILYSDIVDLPQGSTTALYPNVISKGTIVHVNFGEAQGYIVITDVAGRKVYVRQLVQGLQNLSLPKLPAGIYFYKMQNADGSGRKVTGKIIVQ